VDSTRGPDKPSEGPLSINRYDANARNVHASLDDYSEEEVDNRNEPNLDEFETNWDEDDTTLAMDDE
jgi:hypothetical protein